MVSMAPPIIIGQPIGSSVRQSVDVVLFMPNWTRNTQGHPGDAGHHQGHL